MSIEYLYMGAENMSYEELSLTGLIKEIKDVTDGPHPRKFCFVLGAGASRTSGIKSGQELVNIWDKELLERNPNEYERWKNKHGITDENKHSFYSHYYDKRFPRISRDGYNYLEKLMERAKPSLGYVVLAYLLSKPEHNVVITTNFDHLIEDSVSYYMQNMPRVIGHEALAHYVEKQPKRPTVIKIHRDLLLGPASRVADVDKLPKEWGKPLEIIFSEYHPVFIGYAGNDNSLMNYLIEKGSQFASGELCYPYWMLYKGDKIEGRVAEFLELSNGYLVRHDGFDELLLILGAELGYKIPAEEEFLSEAKNRYKKLSDSYDEFNKKQAKEMAEHGDGAESEQLEKAVQQVSAQAEQQRIYREAVVLQSSQKYDEALASFRKLVELSPDNARYINGLGDVFYYMERYGEACEEYRKAVKLEPDNAEYRSNLGAALHKTERYEEALAENQKAEELAPENAQYHSNLGVTLHEMKRYDDALAENQKAEELAPENAQYHSNLGVTLHEMKRYDEALAEKWAAVVMEPKNAEYRNSLGVTMHEMKRYDEALAGKRKAVELEPDNAWYHDSLGVTLHEMGRYDEALAEKQKAVELAPENARYHDSLGVTLHKMERYDEALAEKRKAVELEPDKARYHGSLGVTLHEMGRYGEAYAEKRKAVELAPENMSYHESLEKTRKKMIEEKDD